MAEAGVYEPIALGEDFTLNGCGSTFAAESLCNLTDLSQFDLVWMLGDQDLGNAINNLTIQTGAGTPFTHAGDYVVTLNIRFDGSLLGSDGRFVDLLSGGTIFLPGDIILTSLDTAIIHITSVPAPAGLFLLAPGIVYVVRRERKRRKEKAKPAKT